MGAFDDKTNIILPDPDDPETSRAFRDKWGWDPHEQVIFRPYNAGDHEEMTNASVSLKNGEAQMHAGTGRMVLMDRLILDWTLTRNGEKLPKTIHNIRLLPEAYMTPILEVCDRLAATRSAKEQEDFFASANGHSSAHSEQVKASLKRS